MKMQEEGLFSLNKDLGKPQDEDKNCHRWTNYVIFFACESISPIKFIENKGKNKGKLAR
jgi:hypothetical protein